MQLRRALSGISVCFLIVILFLSSTGMSSYYWDRSEYLYGALSPIQSAGSDKNSSSQEENLTDVISSTLESINEYLNSNELQNITRNNDTEFKLDILDANLTDLKIKISFSNETVTSQFHIERDVSYNPSSHEIVQSKTSNMPVYDTNISLVRDSLDNTSYGVTLHYFIPYSSLPQDLVKIYDEPEEGVHGVEISWKFATTKKIVEILLEKNEKLLEKKLGKMGEKLAPVVGTGGGVAKAIFDAYNQRADVKAIEDCAKKSFPMPIVPGKIETGTMMRVPAMKSHSIIIETQNLNQLIGAFLTFSIEKEYLFLVLGQSNLATGTIKHILDVLDVGSDIGADSWIGGEIEKRIDNLKNSLKDDCPELFGMKPKFKTSCEASRRLYDSMLENWGPVTSEPWLQSLENCLRELAGK